MYLQALSKLGKKGFYEGKIAQAIVELVQSIGGVLDLDDLSSHVSENVQPISATYKVMIQKMHYMRATYTAISQ